MLACYTCLAHFSYYGFQILLCTLLICFCNTFRFSKLRTAAGGQRLSGKLQGARVFAEQLQKTARQSSRQAQQMEKRNAALSAALKIKKVIKIVRLLTSDEQVSLRVV